MAETETQDEDLDELFTDVDKQTEENKNETPNTELIAAFVSAISGITKIASEHSGIKSLALTQNDEATLKTALAPLSKYLMQMLTFLPYMPLIVFAMGYTARVVGEIQQKRKEAEEKGEAPVKKKPFWGK